MMNDELLKRAKHLHLYGLIEHWQKLEEKISITTLLQWEEESRQSRGLKNRLYQAKLLQFKPLADFDWSWPKQCDRETIEELMQLDFIKETSNVVLVGPNGVGKSTIACNIAYQAILKGHKALFITASQMLNDLVSQDGDIALNRRLKHLANIDFLCVDEVGYLSYSNRHADLLFEIISRRYKKKSTLITTNKPFIEWDQIFPNASCVVSLVDRLVHKSEIVNIDAESYRLKEAKERNVERKKARSDKKKFDKLDIEQNDSF